MNLFPSGRAYSNKGYGGWPMHCVMQGGDSSQAEMIKSTKRGLLISEFHYTNFVNPKSALITGLTRNGTFLIEDGKVTKAVSTMRFTQSLLEAFNNVVDLSKECSVVNSNGWANVMPYAKIEGFCFP
jgi:predicted Zn-dependent protease